MRSVTLPPAFVGRFRSLSLERLERVEAAWAAVIAGDQERSAEVHHELHTLKGDARVVGFGDIQLLAHKLEELLAAAEQRHFRMSEEIDLVMTMGIRLMVMLLRTREGVSLGGIDVDGFVQQINELLADDQVRTVASTEGGPVSRRTLMAVEPLDRVAPATQQRLSAAATDVFLEHLRQTGPARARLIEVWRALSRQIAELHAAPLGPRLSRHQDAALRLAHDLGKEVTVELVAGDVRVRADAADALDAAVLHLIRNAVDHGIELPEERVRAGKAPAGRIVVQVRVVDGGGEVVVEDDGRGVDLVEVRRCAEALGFLSRREAEAATDEGLLELVLQKGFSTRTQVSDVSGRGIGLDAVRTALARVGGRISLSTRPGQGTAAVARVPQASRRIRVTCFPVCGADMTLAVPASFEVKPVPSGELRGPEPLDALALLEIPASGSREPHEVLELSRESFAARLAAGGPPFRRIAERFCPTPDDHPVEVVLLDEEEALLIRPEILLRASS